MAGLSWRYRLLKLLERLREKDDELAQRQQKYMKEIRDRRRRRREGGDPEAL